MKILLFMLTLSLSSFAVAQCNQHVFSSVGAETPTQFQYQDCESLVHFFTMPTGGYTVILCADIGTAFVLNGDGFVYPLLTEHPAYPSCIQPPACQGDFDNDGTVDVNDLLTFLDSFGICG